MLSWATMVAAAVAAVWFLRGLWVATQRPRLSYRSHELTTAGVFITVDRQQLLPPWLNRRETWLLIGDSAYRENEARTEGKYDQESGIYDGLCAIRETIKAREELLKEALS
jgi:hypothetical protein